MVQTNTEYMSDPARADRVIRKFMGMTLRELREACGNKGIGWIVDDLIIPIEGLSAEKTQDMTYIEFACLIERVGVKPEYDEHEDIRRSMQQVFYRMIAENLEKGNKTSIPIRLFMALPLKAFYDSLGRYARRNSTSTVIMKEGLYTLMKECRNRSEDYTVGDFISEKVKAAGITWRLMEPLEGYEKGIKEAHTALGKLLIENFHWAFPKSFYAADILDKYRAPAVCEGGDGREEGWERQAG